MLRSSRRLADAFSSSTTSWAYSSCRTFSPRLIHGATTAVDSTGEPAAQRRRRRRAPPPLDQTPYLDPSSLRKSLDNVRDANRASLIRKVDGSGYQERLTIHPPARPPAEHLLEAYTPPHAQFASSKPVLLGRYYTGNPAGKVPMLRPEWKARGVVPRLRFYPWLSFMPGGKSTPQTTTASEQLSAEVEGFGNYMRPSARESAAAAEAVSDIQDAVKSIDPDINLDLIGSRASGLASALSDLDFNAVSKTHGLLDDVLGRRKALRSLRRLSQSLRRMQRHAGSRAKIQIIHFVDRAKIPIILGTHLPTGLEFQIQQTTNAYNSTQYAKMHIQEFPTLTNIFRVIKQMLAIRGLSDGSSGGLTSYPLLNMLVASLKLCPQHDQASQLLSFLQMYSEIDFCSTGISVTPPALVPKNESESEKDRQHSKTDEIESSEHQVSTKQVGERHKMYLRDPADPSNDLGRNCGQIRDVQATFIAARSALGYKVHLWDKQGKATIFLGDLIGADYAMLGVERLSLQRSVNSEQAEETSKRLATGTKENLDRA